MDKQKISFSDEEARRIKNRFRGLALVSFLLLISGTLIIHYLEDFSLFDSFYFAVVSLTTVGYGDISPQTTGGKIFVIIFLIFGISILAATINTMFQNILANRSRRDK